MAKLPLNEQANSILNITFSENKEKDHEIKKEMISVLEEKKDYKKDEETSKVKRERREKIRDLAGDDPEKIGKLKDVLYDNDNKEDKKETEKTEQKESIEDLSKLEKENFRIDSTGWKEIVDPKGVKVKENSEGDVREYLEGNQKGEQLFTGPLYKNGKLVKEGSAIRETKKAGKKLPKSWTVYSDIIEKKYEGDYQDFLKGEGYVDKDGKKTSKFCGWRNPSDEIFNNFDIGFNVWCGDGSNFNGSRNGWYQGNNDDNFGFSVRCV